MNRSTDSERFGALIAGMAAMFSREATEAMLAGYWLGLGDLPIEAVERAVAAGIRSCKFMPVAAELRELAGDSRADDRALLAWAAFECAVTTHGACASVTFDDPLINAACRMNGGWERCCELPPEQFDVWLRKDFLKAYETLCRTGAEPALCLPLGGYCDRLNAAGGFAEKIREPVRIGVESEGVKRIGSSTKEPQ